LWGGWTRKAEEALTGGHAGVLSGHVLLLLGHEVVTERHVLVLLG
jgi:hypothetical protein